MTAPELAEAVRLELDGTRVTAFLTWAMGILQQALSEEGLDFGVFEPHIADRFKGEATRRLGAELLIRSGQQPAGLRVSARVTAVLRQTGAGAMSLSVQYLVDRSDSVSAPATRPGLAALPILPIIPMSFPLVKSEALTVPLSRPAGMDASSGFLLREAMTNLTQKFEAPATRQVVQAFCAALTDRMEP